MKKVNPFINKKGVAGFEETNLPINSFLLDINFPCLWLFFSKYYLLLFFPGGGERSIADWVYQLKFFLQILNCMKTVLQSYNIRLATVGMPLHLVEILNIFQFCEMKNYLALGRSDIHCLPLLCNHKGLSHSFQHADWKSFLL